MQWSSKIQVLTFGIHQTFMIISVDTFSQITLINLPHANMSNVFSVLTKSEICFGLPFHCPLSDTVRNDNKTLLKKNKSEYICGHNCCVYAGVDEGMSDRHLVENGKYKLWNRENRRIMSSSTWLFVVFFKSVSL